MQYSRNYPDSIIEAIRNTLGTSGVVTIITDNPSEIVDKISFKSCVFNNNAAKNGAAIYIDRSGAYGNRVDILRSVFMNNQAMGNESKGGAIFVRSGRVILSNSLLFGNKAFSGNALYFTGDLMRVTQCTIANVSDPTKGSADIRVDTKGLYVDNSVLFSNGLFLIKESSAATTPNVFRCLSYPVALSYAVESITEDPVFVNPSLSDFRVVKGSPCINSAIYKKKLPYYKELKEVLLDDVDNDFDVAGAKRNKPDIGAFEYTTKDTGFFLNSDENGEVLSGNNAETYKDLLDNIEKLRNGGSVIEDPKDKDKDKDKDKNSPRGNNNPNRNN